MLKVLGLTILVPNLLAAAASAAPTAAAAVGPLNTLNQLTLAYYGMMHRQAGEGAFTLVVPPFSAQLQLEHLRGEQLRVVLWSYGQGYRYTTALKLS